MNKSTALKLSFNNEVHRVSTKPQDLKQLLKAVREVFPELGKKSEEKRVSLRYEDSEGDMIVVANDEDYHTALAVAESEGKSLKIFVADDSSEDNQNVQLNASSSIILSAVETQEQVAKNFVEEVSKRDQVEIEDEIVEREPQILAAKEEEVVSQPKEQEEPKVSEFKKSKEAKRAKRFERLREIARKTLQEEIPTIAVIVKEMLEDFVPKPQAQAQTQTKPTQQKENKPVHRGVRCDVCGVSPIVGARYKCTVTYDYDLCENCEARVDHPYPLLKLKTPAQSAVKVNVVLDEQRPHGHGHRHHPHPHGYPFPHHHHHHQHRPQCSKPKKEETDKKSHGLGKFFENLQKTLKPEEVIRTCPFRVGLVRNFMNNLSPKGDAQVPEPKEEVKVEAPVQEVKKTTCPFKTVEAKVEKQSVIEEKPVNKSESDSSLVEKTLPTQETEVTNKTEVSVPEKTEQVQKTEEVKPVEETKPKVEEYTPEVVNKAKVILDIFPQLNLNEVCDVVKQFPKKSIEELAQDFLASF